MFLVKNVHEEAGLQTQTCSNMSHSNAANHLFLCRRACDGSFFYKILGVCSVVYSIFERAIIFILFFFAYSG